MIWQNSLGKDSDGPIPIPNIRYRRYQGLEEKYRYWREISIVSIRLSLRCFTFWSADSAWTTKRIKQRACYFERWINGRVNSIPVCYQSWVICHTWHICRLMYCLLLQYYCCWWIKNCLLLFPLMLHKYWYRYRKKGQYRTGIVSN